MNFIGNERQRADNRIDVSQSLRISQCCLQLRMVLDDFHLATKIILDACRNRQTDIWRIQNGREVLFNADKLTKRHVKTAVYKTFENPKPEDEGAILFVKIRDWEKLLSSTLVKNAQKNKRPSQQEVVSWCQTWMDHGNGTGMDGAWVAFKDVPRFSGLTRDDCFRPAWRKAKASRSKNT